MKCQHARHHIPNAPKSPRQIQARFLYLYLLLIRTIFKCQTVLDFSNIRKKRVLFYLDSSRENMVDVLRKF